MRIRASFAGFCLLLTASISQAEDGQSLEQAASDPTASLMSVLLQNIHTSSFHNRDDADANTFQFRSAVPFSTGNLDHIARLTLPYVTDSVTGDSGFGDATLFDLIVFDKDWGRWGAGAVTLLPTGSSDISAEKWGIGPAFGFVAQFPGMIAGIFNQNIFSFAGEDDRPDVDISIIQPIIDYALPNQWSIGASEMTITYDWNSNEWISLPLGIKVSKLTKPGGQPIQFSLSYEHNFQDDFNGPETTYNFTAKFLFPVR